jgi:hypothetical protein
MIETEVSSGTATADGDWDEDWDKETADED